MINASSDIFKKSKYGMTGDALSSLLLNSIKLGRDGSD
jgi:hypothetical protein